MKKRKRGSEKEMERRGGGRKREMLVKVEIGNKQLMMKT